MTSRAAPAPKLWSRAEYQRLGELGVFANSERVELIEGMIVAMSPQNLADTRSVSRATTLLVKLFSDTHYVRVQCALFLNARSEPEPDFALVAHNLVDGPQVQDNPSFADLGRITIHQRPKTWIHPQLLRRKHSSGAHLLFK